MCQATRIVKDFEKRKVIRREWKTPRERSASGQGSEYDDGESVTYLFRAETVSHSVYTTTLYALLISYFATWQRPVSVAGQLFVEHVLNVAGQSQMNGRFTRRME